MRSVKKPHGLHLVDDGHFFWYGARDPDEPGTSYPAVVEVKNYYPTTSATCLIRTPAEQFIWTSRDLILPIEADGRQIEWECFALQPPVKNWLDANTPGWGMPRYQRFHGGINPGIYFAKRSHALEFCRMVDRNLKGMSFDDDD